MNATTIRKPAIEVSRAAHLGMCFGVRDAIKLTEQALEEGEVTILGDLVHNEAVIQDLSARGARFEGRVEDVTIREVIITAHGASEKRIREVKERGHSVREATCPLVRFAHESVHELARKGYFPVVIGRPGHVEVVGLTEDLADYAIIQKEEDIPRMRSRPRFGVAAQTTQPISKVQRYVGLIRRQFPDSEVRFVDTVCRPTKQRQESAIELARDSDVVIVIGGANSNNTHELMRTSRRHCGRVHHVQSASEMEAGWFRDGDKVGITAGTSTPEVLIRGVESWLQDHFDRPS